MMASRRLPALLLLITVASASPTGLLEQAAKRKAAGDLAGAREAYSSALSELRASGDRAGEASVLVELSSLASALGDFSASSELAASAASLYRALGDSTGEGRAANAAGAALLYAGNYPQALRRFEEALAIAERLGDVENQVNRRNNAGNVHFFQGRYLEALGAYQQSWRQVLESPGAPWNPRARRLTAANLAALWQRLGRYESALELYRSLRSAPGSLPAREEAQLLSNLGALYRRLGDPVKAVETYRQAQRLFARERHADGEIGVRKNLAIALALDLADLRGAERELEAAFRLARASVNAREMLHARLYLGEARFRMKQPGAAERDWSEALETARRLGAREEEWKALYGLGRVAEERNDAERALKLYDASIEAVESLRAGLRISAARPEFLADKRDVYDAAILLRVRRYLETGAAKLDLLDAALRLAERARARALRDQLEREHTGFRPDADAAEIQSRLAADEAALVFWCGAREAAVFWIRKGETGATLLAMTDGRRREIESYAARLSKGEEWREEGSRIAGWLLGGVKPVADPSIRRLRIVPDGTLYLLPFEALPAPDGALLVERREIAYLPALFWMRRDAGGEKRLPPWKLQWLAFGDPVPGTADGVVYPGDEPLGRLPRSFEEVRSIAALLPGRSRLFLGAEANKSRLLGEMPTAAPLLHFSTHAVADLEEPDQSRLVLSPRAGARFDYLFAPEIAALALCGVELVTVPACETERGRLLRGEGVQSLGRAFLAAGARSTVTTLWRVGDTAAAAFMESFYGHIARGESRAASLRSAKLRFLRSGTKLAHPRYWAAFVLNGDDGPVTRAIRWEWLAVPSALALLGVWALAALRARRGVRSTLVTDCAAKEQNPPGRVQ